METGLENQTLGRGQRQKKQREPGPERDGGRPSHPSASSQLSLQPLIRAVHTCFLDDFIQPHGSKHTSPQVTPHGSSPTPTSVCLLGLTRPTAWLPMGALSSALLPHTPSHLHTDGATDVTTSRPRRRHPPRLLSPPPTPSTHRVLDSLPLPFLFTQGPQPLSSGGLLPPPTFSLVSPLPSHPYSHHSPPRMLFKKKSDHTTPISCLKIHRTEGLPWWSRG